MKISGIIKEEICYQQNKFCAIILKFAQMARLLVFNALIRSERASVTLSRLHQQGRMTSKQPGFKSTCLGLDAGQIQSSEPTTEEYP